MKIITDWTPIVAKDKQGTVTVQNTGLIARVYEDEKGHRRVQLDFDASVKVGKSKNGNSVLHVADAFMQVPGVNCWIRGGFAGTKVAKRVVERVAPPPSMGEDDFPTA